MELLFFLLVVAGLILIPERRRKVRSEKNRRNKASRIEVTRTITNPKLADIDTYVYLLVRQHTTLIRKEDRYLKIGIGSHERVKKQLSEQNTYLLKLYMFRSRRNAFQVEQKILQKWNNKFVGDITTQSGIGTEYIKFTLGNLKTALSILSRYEENLIESNKLLIQKLEVNESIDFKSVEPILPSIANQTQVYLLKNNKHKLLKIGIGKLARPDSFRKYGWDIEHFTFFMDRPSALNAEQKVLQYWREELNLPIPENAKGLLSSGYTETVSLEAGITESWNVVMNCPNLAELVTPKEKKILMEFQEIIAEGHEIFPDSKVWEKIREYRWDLLSEYSFYWPDKALIDNNKNLLDESNRELYKNLVDLRQKYQNFMFINYAVINRFIDRI